MRLKTDMRDKYDQPIFILSLPRSGSTWLQHALNQHEDIYIGGQFPWHGGNFKLVFDTVLTMRNASHAPSPRYKSCEYSGCTKAYFDSAATTFLRDVLVGQDSAGRCRSWGLKTLLVRRTMLGVLWPQARIVVCTRDPIKIIESMMNTFVPNVKAHNVMSAFVELADEASKSGAFLWHTDCDHKEEQMSQLLSFLGEAQSDLCLSFARENRVVHKVKPDHERNKKLTAKQRESLMRVQGVEEAFKRLLVQREMETAV